MDIREVDDEVIYWDLHISIQMMTQPAKEETWFEKALDN
jgi:hypothetical protein